jgi:hypothetical protein
MMQTHIGPETKQQGESMETLPDNPANVPPPPPPPPARKSRLGLWLGIVGGIIVVCLCCAIIGGMAWVNRQNIPALSGLFASPTPQGVYYSNTSYGYSLYYPTGWIYNEQTTNTTVFATSQAALDSASVPGAAMGFVVSNSADIPLPAGTDATSPESILGAFISSTFAGTSTVLEASRPYTLGSYPAASTVLSVSSGSNTNFTIYMTVIVTKSHTIIALGITPDGLMNQYRPTFDQILATFLIAE